MLADTARQYARLIPPQSRIGKVSGTRHKGEFAIAETRICVSWLTCDEWSDLEQREPGVSLCQFTLAVKDGKLHRRWHPIANVSLHALARRIEPGRAYDHASLLSDLALLADAGEDAERVETADGFCVGNMCDAKDGER